MILFKHFGSRVIQVFDLCEKMKSFVRDRVGRVRAVKMSVAEEPQRVAMKLEIGDDGLDSARSFILGGREIASTKVSELERDPGCGQ